MTKGRSKRKPETVRVRAEASVHELPPRRLRHKRARLSYKTVLGSGLAVFGTLFLTLVVVELYQAHQTQSVTAPLGKNETAQEERAADGQVSEFAHADGSAAPPTPPAGSTAVGGGEGQRAAATTKIASSGSLPDGSSSTGAKAVAGAAAEKPTAGAAPRPNVPPAKSDCRRCDESEAGRRKHKRRHHPRLLSADFFFRRGPGRQAGAQGKAPRRAKGGHAVQAVPPLLRKQRRGHPDRGVQRAQPGGPVESGRRIDHSPVAVMSRQSNGHAKRKRTGGRGRWHGL